MKKIRIKNGTYITIRELNLSDLEKGFLATIRGINPIPLTIKKAKKYYFKIKNECPNTLIFVALNDKDEVIGMVTLIIDQKFGGKIARLEDVVTREDYRNLGISTALQEHVIEEAKKLKCYKIILNCKPNLINFYKKRGFQEDQVMMKILLN
ncbi:MAG: GNAT family N-acetyltransferase [Promethearchaeota archaeon]